MLLDHVWICFVLFVAGYILVTSEWALTCDSAHSWWLYRAASLGHQATSTMTCCPNEIILSWHWVNQSFPYPNNAERQAKKWQVSILNSLVWLDQVSNPRPLESNPRSSDSLISQNGRRALYSFGHPDWSTIYGTHTIHHTQKEKKNKKNSTDPLLQFLDAQALQQAPYVFLEHNGCPF